MAARTGRPARAGARGDGRTERTTTLAFVGERLRWLARGRSGAADPEAGRVGRRDDAPRTPTADAPGRGVRPGGPAGLSLRARATGVDQPARPASASGRWSAWLDQPCRRDSASGPGPRGLTSRPGGTHPLGVGPLGSSRWPAWNQHLGPGQRGWISRAGGTQPQGEGRGGRPAGPAGPVLRARRSRWWTSRPGGTCAPGAVAAGVTRWTGGTWARGAGAAGVTRWTGGTWARGAGAAGVDQVARRDVGSERAPPGVDQGPRRDLGSGRRARVCGLDGPEGPRLRARVPRGSTRRPAGTQLPGAGPRGSTSWPSGTCSTGAGVAVVDQPARRDLGSGRRARVCGLDGPAGPRLWARGTRG